MLLCIDLLKNHLVYNTAAVILSWDFLHTLLLSWCAIWALSRIDIRLNLVAAAAISWFHADLRNYFLRGAWTWAEGWPPLDRWNLFHTYSLVAVALSAVILLVLLWRQPWPRPLRFVLTAALSVIVVSFVKSISYFEPGTFDYEMARNWWRYGLVGDPLNYTLMPALTWGPSALIGFGGTDWILRNHATVRGWTPRTTGIISFVTAATLIYILLLRTGAWLHTSGPSTWNTYADSQTSFAGELMKLGHFGTLYSLFWFLCQRIRWPRVDDWALSLSRATFWIYIAATALTQILAQSLSTRSRNLTLNFVLTTALTLLFALFIAYMVNWLATKRIALYLRKAEA